MTAAPTQLGPVLSLLMVFVIGIGWAGGFVLNRAAAEHGIPLLAYAFLQIAGSAVIMTLILAVRRERPPLDPPHLTMYGVSGLLALAIPYLAIIYAAPYVPVGVLTLDFALEPAFTYVFALVLALERFHRIRLVGLMIGLGGLMLILIPKASLPSPEMVHGSLWG